MPKLLIIEDEEPVRDNLAEMLEAAGFQILQAENGLLGAQVASEEMPDLIICDVMMPVLDGFGVLQLLRQSPGTADIPFLFLTARTDRTDVRRGMEAGADDYLTKPFTRAELLKAIQTRLEKRAEVKKKQDSSLDALRYSITTQVRHELLTPLSVILNASEILTRYYARLNPDDVQQTGARIQKAGKHLNRLIQKFLLYTQLESLANHPEKITAVRSGRLHAAHTVAAELAQQKARDANRTADLGLQLPPAPILHISESHYKEIVAELLDNAFKYSAGGTSVQLRSLNGERNYILICTDQGRGLTSEQIARLDAYVQFERDIYEQQGLGLGLAIVKRILDIYGGEMTIESVPGQGTTFFVTLPC